VNAQPANAPSEFPVSRFRSSGVRISLTTMFFERFGMIASVRRMKTSATCSLSRSQSMPLESSRVGHSSYSECCPGGAISGWWNVAT
jgi:hypothetical protein